MILSCLVSSCRSLLFHQTINEDDSTRTRTISNDDTVFPTSLEEFVTEFFSIVRSPLGLATITVSATVAATTMAVASFEEGRSTTDKPTTEPPPTADGRAHSRKDTEDTVFMQAENDEDVDTVHGARLISASFRLLSHSFGLVADSVRISGETVAGALGSSVKIVGGLVKTAGHGVDGASRLIAPNKQSLQQRQPLTAERLMQKPKEPTRGPRGPIRSSRAVLAKSIG